MGAKMVYFCNFCQAEFHSMDGLFAVFTNDRAVTIRPMETGDFEDDVVACGPECAAKAFARWQEERRKAK